MRRFARVNRVSGTQLVGTARGRSVVMDRPEDEGGTDSGFISGELLLLAVGSCVNSGLTTYLDSIHQPTDGVWVEVEHPPVPEGGLRSDTPSPVIVTLGVDEPEAPDDRDALIEAATSGRVATRIKRCGEFTVRFAGQCGGNRP